MRQIPHRGNWAPLRKSTAFDVKYRPEQTHHTETQKKRCEGIKMIRRNCVIAMGSAITAIFVMSPIRAQSPYGISIVTSIETDLPTTSSGGGGQYINDPPLIRTTLNSFAIPAYGHHDSVTAIDPNNGGLYTVSARSAISVTSAESGRLSVASDASTYSADQNVQGNAYNTSYIEWCDFLIVNGNGLPKGTPVTLEVKATIDGSLVFSGNGSSGQNIVQFETTLADESQSPFSDVYFDTSSPFSSTKTYLLHTNSGATLTLSEILSVSLAGNFQFSGTTDVNGAHVTVRSLTKGVTIFSVSGVSYDPKAQIIAPNTVNRTQSEAADMLVSSGLSIGRVSTVPSGTVKAGAVIEQIPVPDVAVDDGSPVDLVVSSGPEGVAPAIR